MAAAWRPQTRLVWVEIADQSRCSPSSTSPRWPTSPTNARPWWRWTTPSPRPYLQRPLALGADLVVHSSTKYLGGHSDVVGGLVATDDAGPGGTPGLRPERRSAAVPGPFDCFLTLRGVKTLAVRMDRHCANAAAPSSSSCSRRPDVTRVLYPGLAGHPGHAVAARQMRGFGGMVSFVVAGGEAAALEVARAHPGVDPGRVTGRGGVPHRSSPPDDPRLGGRISRWRSTPPCSASRSGWKRSTT